MEHPDAQKYSLETNSTERKKAKPQPQIFIAKYFKISNRIILLFLILLFLKSPVLGKISQDTSSTKNAVVGTGQKIIISKNGIFYNTTKDDLNNHHHYNNSNICLKGHKIKERDVREEESLGPKGRKIKINEKDRSLGSMGDEEDEDFGFELSGEAYETVGECSSCARDKIRIQFLETIKDSILSKLGMSQPPNVTERLKPKIADHLLTMLLRKRHHSSNGLYWIQDYDSEEMLGDEPYDSGTSDKVNGKNSDFSSKNNFVRSQGNASDNKYSDLNEFQEGEVLMEEDDDYHVRTERIVAFSQPLFMHPLPGRALRTIYSSTVSVIKAYSEQISVYYSNKKKCHLIAPLATTLVPVVSESFHPTTKVFLVKDPKIRHLPNIQYFEFSDRVRSSKIKRALLWIYIKGRETTSVAGNKITISIYKIIDAGKPGISSSRESPVITSVKADSTQFIPAGSGAWITMEYVQIKNLVAEWFRYPQHNLGMVIVAEDANRTNLAATDNNGNDTTNVPFLEVYVTDNRKRRTKRTLGLNCRDSSKETRCCRYPLTVDFLAFGWDWIIAPKKYEAFYCAGECPLAFLPQHPHTHIAQLSNIPGMGACCAPRKLSELDMLYFDQDMNIIFGKVPAMRVDRCGCT